MSDEGPYGTEAFDPFYMMTPGEYANAQAESERPARDIMADRQGFLDSEAESVEYQKGVSESSPSDIQEARRSYAAEIVGRSFTTNDPNALIHALSLVDRWLRDGAPPQTPQEPAGEPDSPPPDDHPSQG